MYKNVGQKIRTYAKIMCWLGVAAAVIGGFRLIGLGMTVNTAQLGHALGQIMRELTGSYVEMDGGLAAAALIVLGLAVTVFGALSAWTGSFMSCGLGELIEDSGARLAALKRSHR